MPSFIDVLQALNTATPALPEPAQPMPLGPLPAPLPAAPLALTTGGQGPTPQYQFNPEPALPPAPPQQPLDMRLVSLFQSLRGAPPTPPPPPTRAQRIFNAIGGFGAGVQGQGAEYLRTLREPQARYEAQLENYNAQGERLGVMGLNAALEKQARAADVQFRRAEMQSTRDFEDYIRRSNVSDETARDVMRQGFAMQLEAARAEHEQKLFELKDRAQRQSQARLFARDYRKLGAKQFTTELANYDAGLSDELSPAAAKWDSAQNQLTMGRLWRLQHPPTGGGVNAAMQKDIGAFEASKRAVEAAVASGDVRSEKLMRRRMDIAFGKLAKYPAQLETGYGPNNFPYQKPRQQPQASASPALGTGQPTGPTRSMAQIRQMAAAAGISEQEGIARAQAAGFQITP